MAVLSMATDLDANLEAIARSTDLNALEKIVTRGRATFLEVGTALWRIREAKLYKSTHSTWESWCHDRWWGSKRHADRQIVAARVVIEMGPSVPIEAETQARELSRAPEQERSAVVQEIERRVGEGGTVTAEDVRAIVEEKTGKAKSPRLQTRRTPKWLFDELDKRFGKFSLDAFADPHNALCPKFYTRENNGCMLEWADVTFGNPEFADMVGPLEQALRQAEKGIRSIILGPVGCSQEWYHQIVIRGTVYVPDRRINYDEPDGTPTTGADRDTIVMAFGKEHANPYWRKGEFRVMALPLEGPK